MTNATSLVLAMLAALLLGLFIPVRAFLSTASSTDRLLDELDPDTLYVLALEATSADLTRMEQIEKLVGSPLELGREDIDAILRRTFTADYAGLKAHDVHPVLIAHLRAVAPEGPFRVYIAEETALLLDALNRYLDERLEALPACPLGEGLETLWDGFVHALEEDPDRREFLRELPRDCRPPEPVRSEILSDLEEELESVRVEARDSVVAFPEDGHAGPEYRRIMRGLRAAFHGTLDAPHLPLGLLVVAALGMAVLHRREADRLAGRLGIVLGGAAVLSLAGGLVLLLGGGELFFDLLTGKAAKEEAGHKWLELGAYAVDRTARVAGRPVIAAAALLGLVAAALPPLSRRWSPGSRVDFRGRRIVDTT